MKRTYEADPKPVRTKGNRARRFIDPLVTSRVLRRLDRRECVACGGPATNGHHLVGKGTPYFGDDVEENIAPLCGSGTTGCHGAYHGNPYRSHEPVILVAEALARGEKADPVEPEYRDREWVGRRIGEWILRTPETLAYIEEKLGAEADSFLERRYYTERRAA